MPLLADPVVRLHDAVADGLAATGTPGAAVVWSRPGLPDVEVACGWARFPSAGSAGLSMTPELPADVASITKLVATTVVAMRLHAAGRLPLDVPVTRFVGAHGPGVDGRTVDHLLTHRSGHLDWLPLALVSRDRSSALDAITGTVPLDGPGIRTRYSDVGMALLGLALEEVAGSPLDALVQEHLVEPLGLATTGYRPPGTPFVPTVAGGYGDAVEQRLVADRFPGLGGQAPVRGWRQHVLDGEVDDANAWHAFGGVAGHAGLFASARDLARIGRALLTATASDAGWLPGSLVRRWATPGPDARIGRGFWTRRVATSFGPGRGVPGEPVVRSTRPDPTVGHRGFTGCELLLDPRTGSVLVLVANRRHGTSTPRDHASLWRSVLEATVAHREGGV